MIHLINHCLQLLAIQEIINQCLSMKMDLLFIAIWYLKIKAKFYQILVTKLKVKTIFSQ
jgi:hypothetical protein